MNSDICRRPVRVSEGTHARWRARLQERFQWRVAHRTARRPVNIMEWYTSRDYSGVFVQLLSTRHIRPYKVHPSFTLPLTCTVCRFHAAQLLRRHDRRPGHHDCQHAGRLYQVRPHARRRWWGKGRKSKCQVGVHERGQKGWRKVILQGLACELREARSAYRHYHAHTRENQAAHWMECSLIIRVS